MPFLSQFTIRIYKCIRSTTNLRICDIVIISLTWWTQSAVAMITGIWRPAIRGGAWFWFMNTPSQCIWYRYVYISHTPQQELFFFNIMLKTLCYWLLELIMGMGSNMGIRSFVIQRKILIPDPGRFDHTFLKSQEQYTLLFYGGNDFWKVIDILGCYPYGMHNIRRILFIVRFNSSPP